ncbi:MAG: bifunctional riboflavin kinase/FAD synthetase, partial [Planctomycetes bacterium]|nr:bifunctional riboflavin kinase/FAD synthetase [Planctomycetota bacterium]
YLLSQAGQLYGRTMAVRFANRLRGQQKFQSARQLVQQMEKDVACVREILE